MAAAGLAPVGPQVNATSREPKACNNRAQARSTPRGFDATPTPQIKREHNPNGTDATSERFCGGRIGICSRNVFVIARFVGKTHGLENWLTGPSRVCRREGKRILLGFCEFSVPMRRGSGWWYNVDHDGVSL